MRTLIFTMSAALVLVGCGDSSPSGEVATQVAAHAAKSVTGQAGKAAEYQIKIADVDFLDMQATNALAKSLDPADSYAFLLYAIAWKASKVSGDETEIRDASGALPVTVKDAVAIQQAVLATKPAAGG